MPKTPGPAPAAGQIDDEDGLLARLDEKQAQLSTATAKLQRLAAAQAALDGERWSLGTQLAAEEQNFADVNRHLKHCLEEQTCRADGLERRLAEVQAQLAAAHQAAAADAQAAEERRQADVAQQQAALEGQRDQVQQAEAFLAERDSLRAQAEGLLTQLEDEKRQHHTRQMDQERKHAADRELWRRDTEQAVRAAQEEMAALTDQRLEATTRQTIFDNEAMAGELQYQGRQVQGLLSRNTALQGEAAELRVLLSISRRVEDELAAKVLACEKTIDSLLARLKAVESDRAAGQQAVADVQEQLQAAQGEVQAAQQRLEAQAERAVELQEALDAARVELGQLQAGRDDAANFLLQCVADARQEVLAEQGHAALAAAGSGGLSEGQLLHATAPTAPPPSQQLLLAGLPSAQREAVLRRLLQQLGIDWQGREGLVLPSSSSPSGCFTRRTAEVGGVAGQLSALSLASYDSSLPADYSHRPAAAAGSSTASSQLMQQLLSEVRPWPGRRAAGMVPARLPAVGSPTSRAR